MIARNPDDHGRARVARLQRRHDARRSRQRTSRVERCEDRTLLAVQPFFGTGVAGPAASTEVRAMPEVLAGKIQDHLWSVAIQAAAARARPEPGRPLAARVDSVRPAVIDETGAVETYVHVSPWRADVAAQLAALGATVQYVVPAMGVVQAKLRADQVEAVSRLASVSYLELPSYGGYSTGSVNTAGDAILKADQVRQHFAAYGIDGRGVKVGVISNGVANAWRVAGSPHFDLPTSVVVGAAGAFDEGTAMLEIVHDIAPGASLYFYGLGSAPTAAGMITAIDWMRTQGVDVIVDDVYLLGQPFLTDGPVASAAYRASIEDNIVYVTAAGNFGTPGTTPSDKHHYQRRFDDADGDRWHEWSSSSFDEFNYVPVPPGATLDVVLQWSDSWGFSTNNYDLYLYDDFGNYLVSADVQAGRSNDFPYEYIRYTNTSAFTVNTYIAVRRTGLSASTDRVLELYTDMGGGQHTLEYAMTADSIFGIAARGTALTVGAVNASDPGNDDVALYSGRGPSTIFYDTTQQLSTVRDSLDGVAIDGVQTRIGQLGYFGNPFFGTSAAAPHAAGLAALILSANTTLSFDEVTGALTGTAVDLGISGYDATSGFGRFDGLAAVYKVFVPGAPDMTAASDTGASNTDNITRNTTPTFTGTVPANSFVRLYANGVQVGSQQLSGGATTYSIKSATLAPGDYLFTVRIGASSSTPAAHLSNPSPALPVTIDTTVAADIIDVTPDPRATPVSTITIVFDSPVSGFDRGDLRLFRNGSANLLTNAQTLTTTDGRTYTLNNLAGLTAAEGAYELRLVASNSGIVDIAGNTLAANVSDTFQVIINLTVTNTNDSGAGSLRQALLDANAIAGPNTIRFAIGTGLQTIRPTSPLPTIGDPVVIDGTTQPGYAGSPLIEIDGSSAGDTDGLVVNAGGSTLKGLVVNRFARSGIVLTNGDGNLVQLCYIGTDATGMIDRGNTLYGIQILDGSDGNTIGGNGAGNVLSGNDQAGVWIKGTLANIVIGNRIGTNQSGTAALGNYFYGIIVSEGARNNVIGGTTAGAGNLISGNSAGTGAAGITLYGINTTANLVVGNVIGTNLGASAAIPNGRGVEVWSSASSNTIGGTSAGAGNLIAGNNRDGVAIYATAADNLVQGNRIGVDAAGASALGNGGHGVFIASGGSGNTIGGTAAGAGNVISGNAWDGVALTGTNTRNNMVQGNRIGTNAQGTAAIANGQRGVELWSSASNNTIGGTAAGAGNLISGNTWEGVGLFNSGTTGNLVQGNQIGTDITGTLAVGNRLHGVYVDTGVSGNTIGGAAAGAGNVLSGNLDTGIWLRGAANTLVEGNWIGATAAEQPLGNLRYGVYISDAAAGNTLRNNTIAYNQWGVTIVGANSVRNVLRGNAIHSHAGLGIDLGANGVTPNDAGDGDGGPNGLQNFPVLSNVVPGTTTRVVGSLNSKANTTYTIEVFVSPAADPSGYGEGARFLGSFTVTTNASGNASFDRTLSAATGGGAFAATATDPDGNTSEFSACFALAVPDLVLRSAVGDGFGLVTLTYEIQGTAMPAFQVGAFRSADTLRDAGDVALGTITLSAPSDLTVGTHVVTVPIGAGAGQFALPGAGADENDADYHILFVLDPGDAIAENDADPSNEDNTAPFVGAYHPASGSVYVHGSADNDVIAADPSGTSIVVTQNTTAYTYAAADVASIRLRAHAGDDVLSVAGVALPVRSWGGTGADTWRIVGTSGADTIAVAKDAADATLKATRAGIMHQFAWDAADRIELYGLGGKDKLSVGAAVTLPALIDGGAGNDTLTGGGGDDTLLGGAGDDVINGKTGRDVIDGGAGNDTWTFEGTTGADFLDVSWDAGAGQIVVNRRATLTGSPTETDRAAGVELAGLLGLGGADRIDASALTAANRTAAGLSGLTLDGGAGNDNLIGSAGADTLIGGAGNDTANGGGGADLFSYAGTGSADLIDLVLEGADLMLRRRNASGVLQETDRLIFDASDRVSIQAGGGADTIHVDDSVSIGGVVDGGAGIDTCTVPVTGWTKKNCEL